MPRKSVVHRTTLFLVWLAMAVSGIVFAEPAPVDALLMGLVVLLPAVGLARFDGPLLLLLCGWLLIAATGCVSSLYAIDSGISNMHVFVTFYLSVAAVVLAAFVRLDPARHVHLLMGGSLVAAVVATVAALVGYFNIVPPLTDLLTEFGRARGTFKDPNVYGAFVVPAFVYAMHLWHVRRGLVSLVALAAAGLLVLGVLLSFSRGAWSNAVLSTAVFGYLALVTARTGRQQMRLIALAVLGSLLAVGVVAAALQSESVSRLMAERAQVTQDYDVGPGGRFGGHERAQELILEHPWGIGARQFGGNYHAEDVHQVYLSMFLNHGWLGGGIYVLIVAATAWVGLSGTLRPSSAQGIFIAVYAAFIGCAGEGFIVDTDHWRHFFFLLAMVWGLYLGTALERRAEGMLDGLAARPVPA